MFSRLTQSNIFAHAGATAAAFGAFQLVRLRLDALYAVSRHPVDYATGQTTFDGIRIKEFYAHMQAEGTLGIYVQTQLFDFLFIACVALLGLTLGTLTARLGRPGSLARRAGIAAAISAMGGAAMDAAENLVSFVMLADPAGFPNWLALPYSGFAVAKFALMTLAMALVLITLILAAAGRATRRPALA